MTSDVQTGRWDNLLRRVAGMQGPGSKMREIVPSAVPVFPLEGGPHDLQLIGGKFSFISTLRFTPAVGFAASILLINPSASGKLIVVDQVLLTSSLAGMGNLSIGVIAGVVNTVIPTQRDGRIVSPHPVARLHELSLVATNLRQFTVGPTTVVRDMGWTISPNRALSFRSDIIDAVTDVAFVFSERVAEPSELTEF